MPSPFAVSDLLLPLDPHMGIIFRLALRNPRCLRLVYRARHLSQMLVMTTPEPADSTKASPSLGLGHSNSMPGHDEFHVRLNRVAKSARWMVNAHADGDDAIGIATHQ